MLLSLLLAMPLGMAAAGAEFVPSSGPGVPSTLETNSGQEDVLMDIVGPIVRPFMDCTDAGIFSVGTTCEPQGGEPAVEVGPLVILIHDRVFEEECNNLPLNPTVSRAVCAAVGLSTP